jgi:hypothetical protein
MSRVGLSAPQCMYFGSLRNFWRRKRPRYYFERQTFRRARLIPWDALRLNLSEHPYVAILLDQYNLRLRVGRKFNPVIAVWPCHKFSLPLARPRTILLRKNFYGIRLVLGEILGTAKNKQERTEGIARSCFP